MLCARTRRDTPLERPQEKSATTGNSQYRIRQDPQPRFDELKRLSFVRGLLSHPGEKEPAKIPEVQMEKLRFMLGQTDVPVELENNVRQLKVGEGKYRVMRGPFRGLEGTIYYMRDGDVRVGVLLQGLGFANVRINKSDIERI